MNRNWRRVVSERGSVYMEYAMLACVMMTVAIAVFTPALSQTSWAGAYYGDDFVVRDALINLPFF